jgi:hypothetical protein
MIVIVPIVLLVGALAITYAIRNGRVYNYRARLLVTIAEQIPIKPYDIDWRIAAYNTVGYFEMLLKFWKPLDSFYPDKSFLDLNDVCGHARRGRKQRDG